MIFINKIKNFQAGKTSLNENEKICYQWENNCFQMIHSMIEYTLIANKGDEVHVRLFRPRLFRKVVPFLKNYMGIRVTDIAIYSDGAI